MEDSPRDEASQSLDCCPAGGKYPSSSAPKMASCEKLTSKKKSSIYLPAQNIASICSLLSAWGSLAGLGTAWPFPRALNFALALALDWVAIAVLRQRQRHLLSGTPLSLSAAKLMSFNTLQLLALRYNNLLFLFEYLLLSCASLSCKLAIFGERALSGACFCWAATLSSSTSRSPPPPR